MVQLTTLNELSVETIMHLLHQAEEGTNLELNKQSEHYTVANLFFEPSTRTKLSFEMAQKELGFHTLNFDVTTSSVQKGESLYDTVKTLEAIGCHAAVIRHPQEKYYKELEDVNIPIINGGDGAGDHPTQSLLDLLTIYQEFHTFKDVHVVICGDIRHSRVARTNAMILRRLGAVVSFSGPKAWMDEEVTENNVLTIDDAIKTADVIMLLRIQTERHDDDTSLAKGDYLTLFGLTAEREKQMQDHAIIMHPAPVNRGVELASELVECERSRIFKQMKNGVKVRKAVLEYVLKEKGEMKHESLV
ncbi:aspartate carbamoyltransferase catalytic subunit [Bacillus shivajii]|uniref:aspartate carbamoyltransferase catalytic subunit n=1 Tax=Bacillus shivajii TaxID=1983719 RepID=UPI001CFC4006|nr:aspartate carbamoyltransferase catalytic subunit [Bacillus shivajii]UCZ51801.1 aspartate carbamoyltransferase catalytic subunit [Bacillus shivajii]